MDEVDSMLDTYGYRTGGRVGYAEGRYGRYRSNMKTSKNQISKGIGNS